MVQAIGLPQRLQKYAGRILDVDAHEMMPIQAWTETFGADAQPLVQAWSARGLGEANHANHPNVPDYAGDILPINADIVTVKGCRSPGAGDPVRRLEVMDAMGIDRQLMFPGFGGYAFQLLVNAKNPEFLPMVTGNRAGIGKRGVDLYNEWAVGIAQQGSRIRPVVPVYGDTAEELFTYTKSLVDRGIKAIWLAAPVPPANLSPAHPDLDPFWAMLAEADCVVTLHIGTEGDNLLATTRWREAPAFEGHISMGEFQTDPWSLSVLHLPCQNFLAAMITGGVFVRHPRLRVGVIEVGAYWVGPLAETLDLWHINLGALNSNDGKLTELPSAYIRSNVRVSPFYFEDVAMYIDRYQLEDVICFASDYPHVEGGKDIFNGMYSNLERLGPDILDKFFVGNGAWILPD
jgi:predicted TIM-barrel fold metal-dependent hydrolase